MQVYDKAPKFFDTWHIFDISPLCPTARPNHSSKPFPSYSMSTIISELSGGPIRPTHLDTTGESGYTGAIYTRKEQIEMVLQTIRARDVKIAVISNSMAARNYSADKACATSVATELNKMLSGSKALVYEYEIKNKDNWLDYLRSVEVKYYIFVNLPPHDPYYPSTRESEYFSPRSHRISEVVVVHDRKATTPGGTRSTSYTPVHYLDKFQHLDGSPADIASKALCHFAGR